MDSLDLGTLKIKVKADGVDEAQRELNSVTDTIDNVDEANKKLASEGIMSNRELQSSILKLAHEYKASGLTMSEAMIKANAEIRSSQKTLVDENSKTLSTFGNLSKSFLDSAKNTSVFGMKLGDLGGALSSSAGLSSLMQGAVAGLAASLVNLAVQALQQAIAAMIEFGKQAVQVASDLEEELNVVETVFGKENKVVKWSEENAQAFNLSTLEAQRFAGTLGAILTPSGLGIDVIEDMSINLTKLSGDLGSLWNKESEQAFNALRAGLTGETEPLKQFGIVMTQVNLEAYMLTQGIEKQWKELTQAEQALVRYNYILENTKTAQGDATKTADGYANATKQMELAIEDAGGAFGQGFLPALTSMKQQIATFIKDNEELIAFVGNTVGTVLNYLVEFGRFTYALMKPFIEVINYMLTGVNEVLKFFNDGLQEASQDIRSSYKQMGEEVTYTMQDLGNGTKSTMSEAAKSVTDSFGAMEESAKTSVNGINDAYKSFFQKNMSEYEKQLREQYDGGTLAEEKKIQKKLALHEQVLKRQLEEDEKYYKRSAELAEKYMTVTRTEGNKTISTTILRPGSRNANGTDNFKGGLTRMNEIGSELTFVQGGAKIVNNYETREMFNNIADNSGVESRLDSLIGAIQRVERVVQMLPSEQQMLARGGTL